ncbi:acyltransferase [Paraclostridium bifermentans]|uniref:acyltransferase n=1 Tax=Paraclostridium bifermentans TaxID=1490 RepID=UPI00374E8CE5
MRFMKFIRRYPIMNTKKNLIIDIKNYRILKFKYLGLNTNIEEEFCILNPQNIKIEDNVFIGRQSYIDAKGGLLIKEGTMIGPRVFMITSNHVYNHNDLKSIPYENNNLMKPITINENVWIGANVTILPGVNIGEGAVVSMGSVVTKDVEPMAVVGGNPAKTLKYRDKQVYNKLKLDGKIYYKLYREGIY